MLIELQLLTNCFQRTLWPFCATTCSTRVDFIARITSCTVGFTPHDLRQQSTLLIQFDSCGEEGCSQTCAAPKCDTNPTEWPNNSLWFPRWDHGLSCAHKATRKVILYIIYYIYLLIIINYLIYYTINYLYVINNY